MRRVFLCVFFVRVFYVSDVRLARGFVCAARSAACVWAGCSGQYSGAGGACAVCVSDRILPVMCERVI